MDNLFDTPSGPILHRDVQAVVDEDIRSVLYDLVVESFQNLCRMSANEIACFDPLCPAPLVDPNDFDCSFDNSSTIRGKQCFSTSPKYFYTIGDYECSSFYCKFLLDEAVCMPSGHMVSVRKITG